MAVLVKGTDFTTGDQVSAANLDNLVDAATFAAGAVDNSTTQLSGGSIIVKDGGISTAKIADDAVTDAKLGYPLTAVDVNGGAIDGTPIGANSASTVAATTISASGVISANGSIVFNGGSVATSSIATNATNGFIIIGKAGSTSDFYVGQPGTTTMIIQVPTGTINVQFASLAGSGTRAVYADANGVLSAP